MTIDIDHWNSNLMFVDRPGFDPASYAATRTLDGYDLREKLEQWQEDGVVQFEDCVPAADIEALVVDVQTISERRANFDLEVEYMGERFRIRDLPISPLSDTRTKFNCMENVSLAARRLSLNRTACAFMKHVFQDFPVVIQSLTFWRGSEQSAHLDYPWVRIQTKLPHLVASWIPLEDIHEDSGPLAYYPGSHRPGMIRPFDWGGGSLVQEPDSSKTPGNFVNHLAEEIDRLGLKKKTFLPKRGDLLLWHGSLLHEGTVVRDRSRTRRSYVTHYTSLSAYPPTGYRYPQAIERGLCTALNGGFVFDHPWVTDARTLPSWGVPG